MQFKRGIIDFPYWESTPLLFHSCFPPVKSVVRHGTVKDKRFTGCKDNDFQPNNEIGLGQA